MNKVSLTIIAAIISSIVIAVFSFESANGAANYGATPSATPKRKTIGGPTATQLPPTSGKRGSRHTNLHWGASEPTNGGNKRSSHRRHTATNQSVSGSSLRVKRSPANVTGGTIPVYIRRNQNRKQTVVKVN